MFPKNFSHRGAEVEYDNITIMLICQSKARRVMHHFECNGPIVVILVILKLTNRLS